MPAGSRARWDHSTMRPPLNFVSSVCGNCPNASSVQQGWATPNAFLCTFYAHSTKTTGSFRGCCIREGNRNQPQHINKLEEKSGGPRVMGIKTSHLLATSLTFSRTCRLIIMVFGNCEKSGNTSSYLYKSEGILFLRLVFNRYPYRVLHNCVLIFKNIFFA